MKSQKLSSLIALVAFTLCLTPTNLAAQDEVVRAKKAQHHHYKLVDVGTFGGPESYINPAYTFGSHEQINLRGTVVGGSATSISTTSVSNPFVCGGLEGSVPLVNHAFKWQHGDVTNLGALPGGDNCSVANSINDRGEIVGTSENGALNPVLGITQVRAVLWRDGGIEGLGAFGGNYSNAGGINKWGQVVGFALNDVPDPFSFIEFGLASSANGTQTRAFLWEDGVMHDLGTLGGPDAVGLFINDHGQVAGFSYTNASPNPLTGLPTMHPFLWDRKRGMIDLGSLGGTLAGPLTPAPKPASESGGFNNRGQFVGIATVAGDQVVHPFLWNGDKLIDLFTETVGGNPVSAAAINDGGEVVGGALFPNRTIDAYLWKQGIATDLGTVDGDGCSFARAINSRGQVVGQSFACDGSTLHAFLWENGSIVDLNKLIPRNSSLQLLDPLAINDRGEIAGIGVPPGCLVDDALCGHAFVLIPCDDDHSDEEGCEDAGEITTATIEDQSEVAIQNTAPNLVGSGLTSGEIAARMLARFGRDHGLGIWPRK